MTGRTIHDAVFHAGKMTILSNFFTFLNAKISGICIQHMVILAQQFVRFANIMYICCCGRDRMDVATSSIHARMDFHAMIPLVPLLGLMHFGISCFTGVFSRAGSLDDGGIHDAPALHHEANGLQAFPDIIKYLSANVMLLQQMPEFQQRSCIRNLLLAKILRKIVLCGGGLLFYN